MNKNWNDLVAESYIATIEHKVPGYQLLHELTVDVLTATLPAEQHQNILVVGAGGGEEMVHVMERNKHWSMTGVDPSKPMLDMAKRRVDSLQMSQQVTWMETTIDQVQEEPVYDAAISLLVFHFVKDKQQFLQEIGRRLKPGAPLVIAAIQGGIETKVFEQELKALSVFMRRQGLAETVFSSFQDRLGESTIPIQTGELLNGLKQAGFERVNPFFKALMIEGFVCYRSHQEVNG
ncbi:class I SAM-dependent methyltransferase [Bacillus sp. NPDC077027]|uniref:class I SAM-dependent methyltransferase n=1 Tax=Bacillus sp. NPDC077027 TaxID=3390548 RepID=UPI003D08A927